MKTFKALDEFKTEAAGAMFTKAQALAVTEALFRRGLEDITDPDDAAQIKKAQAASPAFYLDPTASATDALLDSVGVARFTAEDIVKAAEMLLFDAE